LIHCEAVEVIGQLFNIWYSPLVRCASQQVDSLETAEDIVQEAFLSLFRSLRDGHSIESPKAWLLCVVRREAIKRYREANRHGGVFSSLSEACEPTDPETCIAYRGTSPDQLTRLFSSLTGREREVVLLRVKGLKYREIASALRITVGAVKTMMARSLNKMRVARLAGPAGKEERARNDEIVQWPAL
jgi:RNA polymerase sigma-70 factor, ECF subfamily